MGFFSWMTADTDESIPSRYSDRGSFPVNLLQPGGLPAIHEPNYEGYGVFGGINAYDWMAQVTFTAEQLAGTDEDARIDIGISLDMGDYYVDQVTGDKLTIYHEMPALVQALHGIELRHLGVNYSEPLPEFDGMTANEIVGKGRWVQVALPRPPVELRFSRDKNASFESLQPSKSCPEQGFFYPHPDFDDEGSEPEDEDEDDLEEAA